MSTDEDSEIIRIARELCDSLKARFEPSGVTWMGNLGGAQHLPSDQVIFAEKGPRRGFLVLPVALKGKLDSEDWKPLFISSILIQFKSEFRRIWRTAYIMYRLGLIFGTAILFASIILEGATITFALVAALVFWLFYILLFPKIYNRYFIRKLRLKADRHAAEIIGTERFIQALEKIDTFHILDLEEGKRRRTTIWQRRVGPWPSISERLENLRRR
jgi:hypothetical protein